MLHAVSSVGIADRPWNATEWSETEVPTSE